MITPVVLFVYNRHQHLARTLDCLRNAGVTDLHIVSDGPRDEAALPGVKAVRNILRDIDWTSPSLVERPTNLGLSDSIRSGLAQVFEHHDRAIVIEDDVCVAPEFYEFMKHALTYYRDQPKIAGVTGLRFPFNRAVLRRHRYSVFATPRFCSWGWGTWKDRWRAFDFDAESLTAAITTSHSYDPDRAGGDLRGMISAAVLDQTLTGAWDVFCAANMLVRDEYFVAPVWNMVENTGFLDGTHFDAVPRWAPSWEPGRTPKRILLGTDIFNEKIMRASAYSIDGRTGRSVRTVAKAILRKGMVRAP